MVVFSVPVETGRSRLHVNRTGRCEIFSRLEYCAFLPVVQRNGFHVVQRKASQVDLPVLCVAELDAVEENADVLGAHATDIDGFESSDSAVILDLHPGKIAYRIGDRQGVESLQFFAGEFLGGDNPGRLVLSVYGHLVDAVMA